MAYVGRTQVKSITLDLGDGKTKVYPIEDIESFVICPRDIERPADPPMGWSDSLLLSVDGGMRRELGFDTRVFEPRDRRVVTDEELRIILDSIRDMLDEYVAGPDDLGSWLEAAYPPLYATLTRLALAHDYDDLSLTRTDWDDDD